MTKKIKVLECIRQGQIGGGESHLLSLVENLDKSKFDPVVLSFTDGPMITRLKEMNIPVHVIHTEKPFDIKKWGTVKRFIREQGVDIVHAHGTRANSNVLWAAHSLGKPVIYTIHGWSFHDDQKTLVRKVRVMGEKYLTSRSEINISVSESNRKSGMDVIPSLRSAVVNNGIDQNKFNPGHSFKNIREELHIPANKILVLFIARFTNHKQPLTLIKAFEAALKQNPDLHLLMVGDGDQKSQAEEMISGNNLSEHITLSGFRQDVPGILAAADIFVLPSLWEGLPIGLLEAMAMGKAIIATAVDGTKEIIRNQQNGLLIGTGDIAGNLSPALVMLSKDQDLRETLGKEAVRTVKDRFNANSMTRQIEAMYTELFYSKVNK